MTLSDKTRKIVWGRSGNRCAICRQILITSETLIDDESVVGDECHIHSAKGRGPRHCPEFPSDQLDLPSNLILLCRVHHKKVDDQWRTYTAKILQEMKRKHEAWISECLSEEKKEEPVRVVKIAGQEPTHLVRLTSGRELMAMTDGGCAAHIDHAEPESALEADLLANLLQNCQDWTDLWNDIGSGERVRACFALSEEIAELEKAGFWLFGAREMRRIEGGSQAPSKLPVVHLKIARSYDPLILQRKPEAAS